MFRKFTAILAFLLIAMGTVAPQSEAASKREIDVGVQATLDRFFDKTMALFSPLVAVIPFHSVQSQN